MQKTPANTNTKSYTYIPPDPEHQPIIRAVYYDFDAPIAFQYYPHGAQLDISDKTYGALCAFAEANNRTISDVMQALAKEIAWQITAPKT